MSGKGQHRKTAKLTVEDVLDIRRRLSKGASQTKLAERYGVTTTCIHHIAIGKTWKDVLP